MPLQRTFDILDAYIPPVVFSLIDAIPDDILMMAALLQDMGRSGEDLAASFNKGRNV